MRHYLQKDRLEDDSALFALALGPATRTSIALCGGSRRGFADVSLLYSIWHELRLPVSLVTPPGLDRFLPAGVNWAASADGASKQQSFTAWQLIDSAGLVVIGPNMQLTSAEQVFFARLLPKITVPTLLTDEALSLWSIDTAIQNNSHITWFADIELLARTQASGTADLNRARGVFGVAEYLQKLQFGTDFICTYDAVNLYSFIPATNTLIHSPLHGSKKLARNLMLSLLPVTVFARSYGVELEDRLKVLHYLFTILGAQEIANPQAWPKKIKQALS